MQSNITVDEGVLICIQAQLDHWDKVARDKRSNYGDRGRQVSEITVEQVRCRVQVDKQVYMQRFVQYISAGKFGKLFKVLTYPLREKPQCRQLESSKLICKREKYYSDQDDNEVPTLFTDSNSITNTKLMESRATTSNKKQSSQDEMIRDTSNSEDVPQVMMMEKKLKLIGSRESELRELRQRQADRRRIKEVVATEELRQRLKEESKEAKRRLQCKEDEGETLRIEERELTLEKLKRKHERKVKATVLSPEPVTPNQQDLTIVELASQRKEESTDSKWVKCVVDQKSQQIQQSQSTMTLSKYPSPTAMVHKQNPPNEEYKVKLTREQAKADELRRHKEEQRRRVQSGKVHSGSSDEELEQISKAKVVCNKVNERMRRDERPLGDSNDRDNLPRALTMEQRRQQRGYSSESTGDFDISDSTELQKRRAERRRREELLKKEEQQLLSQVQSIREKRHRQRLYEDQAEPEVK